MLATCNVFIKGVVLESGIFSLLIKCLHFKII